MSRILVVDDKEENCEYLRTLLGAQGYEVQCARHGAEALALARGAPPALIVADLLMPVMDGYSLLARWKADAGLASIPFVVYTATYTEPADEQLALSLGADAFILKPCEPADFLARVREVEQRGSVAAPAADAVQSADGPVLRQYSEALVRKLEQKTLQLEQANRSLQADIAARERAEAQLRQTEEQLRHAQKLEAVGRLVGGVAHDFNNLLSVILTYTALVQRSLPAGDRLWDDLEQVRLAGERAAALTRQLLAFSRQQVIRPRVIELADVVRGIDEMLHRLLGEDIELSLVAEPGSGRILADPTQIVQIAMNLAVNARDAMAGGGKLTIEVRDLELDAAAAMEITGASPGPYALLAVSDTGTGMDSLTRSRLFEPFFTTKEPGKGTGLGLSTVFGIVQQAGGCIRVRSEPGAGATFEIFLPRTRQPLDAESPTAPEPSKLGGPETILLVDDDGAVRRSLLEVLRRNGYRVLDAASGDDALRVSEMYADEIQLLITDVIMPRMTGRELAERLAGRQKGLRVLCVSGYAESIIAHHGVLLPGIALLPKPITPPDLLRKVREVLERP